MSILETYEKQPDEVQDYDIGVLDWLTANADSLASFVVTTDVGITQPTIASYGSDAIKIWVAGGVDGETYKVTCTISTVGGRVKQVELKIKVKEY